ncbi:monocyte to macrophage differentiation factor 2 isoform X3 [Strigops habroptila]|uniref:monocyte to macrophage differentiation factor 2 isoform X3 n=1 Tax=Strigops habroptila TaxID=2489341 RepID=UPI0011CFBA2C|nr:monocyte to macrophage differentiation factor 2 isoform X3 [Strigops habroptila]
MFVSRLLDFQKTRYARFMNHRVPSNCRYQPTEYEHAANCATHAFWILPSILGSSILYILSDDQWETISAWIYGFGLSSLFIVSTIFHTISWKKRHLRTVEHCLHMFDRMVIYFFIAASYAPWLNLRELGPWASHMRWIIWIMASVGTVYVFFFHERSFGGRDAGAGMREQGRAAMTCFFHMVAPNGKQKAPGVSPKPQTPDSELAAPRPG